MSGKLATYKPEVLCDIGMFWPIRTVFFPAFSQGYLCSRDMQGRFKTFNELVDKASLCWIRSW